MYLTTNVRPTAEQAAMFYTLLEKSQYYLVSHVDIPIKRVWSWKYWTFMDKYPEIRDITVFCLIDAEHGLKEVIPISFSFRHPDYTNDFVVFTAHLIAVNDLTEQAERRFHHLVDKNRELLFSSEFLIALGHKKL